MIRAVASPYELLIFPLTDGLSLQLHDVLEDIHTELDTLLGTRIAFSDIDNPKKSGPLHKSVRDDEMRAADESGVVKHKLYVDSEGGLKQHRRRVLDRTDEVLGLDSVPRPSLVFVTGIPLPVIATLPIDAHLLDSPSGIRIIKKVLLSRLNEDALLAIADTSPIRSRAFMTWLQEYLNRVGQELVSDSASTKTKEELIGVNVIGASNLHEIATITAPPHLKIKNPRLRSAAAFWMTLFGDAATSKRDTKSRSISVTESVACTTFKMWIEAKLIKANLGIAETIENRLAKHFNHFRSSCLFGTQRKDMFGWKKSSSGRGKVYYCDLGENTLVVVPSGYKTLLGLD
jgi:hypothetical protein